MGDDNLGNATNAGGTLQVGAVPIEEGLEEDLEEFVDHDCVLEEEVEEVANLRDNLVGEEAKGHGSDNENDLHDSECNFHSDKNEGEVVVDENALPRPETDVQEEIRK